MGTESKTIHEPVLLESILEFLLKQPNEGEKQARAILDCTLGGGGHSEAMLNEDKKAFLVGVDRDTAALSRVLERLQAEKHRAVFVHGNFADIPECITESLQASGRALPAEVFPRGFQFDAILLDLGLSSDQLNNLSRGFSFRPDESGAQIPLDMRMDTTQEKSASTVLNNASLPELRRVFQKGGVGASSGRLASAVVSSRPVETTSQFASICEGVLRKEQFKKDRKKGASKHHHPATVPFQAIRMEVNDELPSIETFLGNAPTLLRPGGRLAVISFHSLEDKAVASAMRKWSQGPALPKGFPGESEGMGKLLTPKAVLPTEDEIRRNPRARSARLRVFEKMSERI